MSNKQHPFDKPSPNWIDAVKEDNTKQIKTPEQWLIDEGYPVSMPISRDTIANIISQYVHQHPVPDASQPAAVPDEAAKDISDLIEGAVNLYCSPFGRPNPETYAYIAGVKDAAALHRSQPAGNK